MESIYIGNILKCCISTHSNCKNVITILIFSISNHHLTFPKFSMPPSQIVKISYFPITPQMIKKITNLISELTVLKNSFIPLPTVVLHKQQYSIVQIIYSSLTKLLCNVLFTDYNTGLF